MTGALIFIIVFFGSIILGLTYFLYRGFMIEFGFKGIGEVLLEVLLMPKYAAAIKFNNKNYTPVGRYIIAILVFVLVIPVAIISFAAVFLFLILFIAISPIAFSEGIIFKKEKTFLTQYKNARSAEKEELIKEAA